MPERAARRNRLLFVVLSVCVIVFLGLFMLYAINYKRDQAKQTRDLKVLIAANTAKAKANRADILAACQANNRARKESNKQLRAPLKEMFGYFRTLVKQQIVADKKRGKKVPLKEEERRYDFLLKFERFYAAVKLLPQLDCSERGT